MEIPATVFKTLKARGEWVELCFMAKAAGKGFPVSKPHGDSARYDVGVECNGRILRVQVKSTTFNRAGSQSYALSLHGSGHKQYVKGTVDFFAAYLVPIDAWYILPFEEVEGRRGLHFTPGGKWEKYKRFREAWDLLRA